MKQKCPGQHFAYVNLLWLSLTGSVLVHLFSPAYHELKETLFPPVLTSEELSSTEREIILISDSTHLHFQSLKHIAQFQAQDIQDKQFLNQFLRLWTPRSLVVIQIQNRQALLESYQFLRQLGIKHIHRMEA